jgi:hypothetical protein
VDVVDRLLGLQGRPPLLANLNLQWNVDQMRRMTPGLNPPGYVTMRISDRLQLQQVQLNIFHTVHWS